MTGAELDEALATWLLATVDDVDLADELDLDGEPVHLLVPPTRLLDDPDVAVECLDVVNTRFERITRHRAGRWRSHDQAGG